MRFLVVDPNTNSARARSAFGPPREHDLARALPGPSDGISNPASLYNVISDRILPAHTDWRIRPYSTACHVERICSDCVFGPDGAPAATKEHRRNEDGQTVIVRPLARFLKSDATAYIYASYLFSICEAAPNTSDTNTSTSRLSSPGQPARRST